MQRDRITAWKGINLQIIFVAIAVAVVSLFWFGPYLYQAYAQFSFRNAGGSASGDIPSGATYFSITRASTPGASLPRQAPMSGVNIANNGLTTLRSARVISSTDGTLRVTTDWQVASFTWEIQTRLFTEFLTSGGKEGSSEDIRVGDLVTVTGDLIRGGAEPAIAAQFVREI